jgi:hypothetical protein
MDNLEELREEIIAENNNGQEILLNILEETNKNIKELLINTHLHGNIDFSILKEMNFGLIDTIKINNGSVTNVTNLPENLKAFHIDNNYLAVIDNLPASLEEIKITNNQIKELNISQLKKLKRLYLDYNRLEVLGGFPESLEELSVSYNKLGSLNLNDLVNLKKLDVSENPITLIEEFQEGIIDFRNENTPSIQFRNSKIDINEESKEKEEENKKEKEAKKNYKDALKIYFELKSKYEKKLYELKKKAYEKGINKKMKKKLVNSVVAPCTKCKRDVGSIFKKVDNKYIAICGDSKEPCGLDIKIYDGESEGSFMNVFSNIDKQFEDSKLKIITHKLDTVFNYIDENASTEVYKTFLENYNNVYEEFNFLFDAYKELYFSEEKAEEINNKKNKIYEYLEDIKRILNDYKETNNEELLKDVAQLQIENILPELRNMRQLKYETKEMIIDYDKGISEVYQLPYNIGMLQLMLTDTSVESFVY